MSIDSETHINLKQRPIYQFLKLPVVRRSGGKRFQMVHKRKNACAQIRVAGQHKQKPAQRCQIVTHVWTPSPTHLLGNHQFFPILSILRFTYLRFTFSDHPGLFFAFFLFSDVFLSVFRRCEVYFEIENELQCVTVELISWKKRKKYYEKN